MYIIQDLTVNEGVIKEMKTLTLLNQMLLTVLDKRSVIFKASHVKGFSKLCLKLSKTGLILIECSK
jgi:hypothetical protein